MSTAALEQSIASAREVLVGVSKDQLGADTPCAQWKVSDLDWSRTPRPMSAEAEGAIVQLFTDMAGIERLAAALFVALIHLLSRRRW